MSCTGVETCEGNSVLAAVSASAMLQVKADSSKSHSAPSPAAGNLIQSSQCMPAENQEVHLMEARDCVPMELQEEHLKAVRHHARFLAAQHREGVMLVGQQKKKAVQPGPPSLEDMLAKARAEGAPRSGRLPGQPRSLEDIMTPAP